MTFVDDLLKKLFSKLQPTKTQTSKGAIVSSEKLIRSYQFMDEFSNWKKNPNTSVLLNSLKEDIKNKQLNLQTNYEIGLLDLPSAKGIILHHQNENEYFNLAFLADLIQEKTKEFGYANYQSKIETEELGNEIKVIESHYLKVSIKNLINSEAGGQNQLYGNILLENIMVNNQPKYLKILATYYQGRNYSTPLPFSEYLNKVFQQ
jgi:hypothetical protein